MWDNYAFENHYFMTVNNILISKPLTSNKVNVAIFIFYSLLTTFLISNHILWLDEAHHWLISVKSETVTELLHNLRYDGHPVLWNVILHFANEIYPSYIAMKVVHLIISLATSIIIIFYTPYSTLQKILILLGYFIFYEYSIISRNYALGVFLILAAAVLIRNGKMDIRFSICVILLPQTNLFGLIFSLVLFSFYINEFIRMNDSKGNFKSYISILLYVLSLLGSLYFIVPPLDHPILEKLFHFSVIDILKLPIIISMLSIFSFPDFTTIHWWNSNLFVSKMGSFAAIFILAFSFILFFFYQLNKKIFWFFGSVFILFVMFGVSTEFLSSRYFGYIFISFLFILTVFYDQIFSPQVRNSNVNIIGVLIVYIVLYLQGIAGVSAAILEYNTVFSSSNETAQFIKSNGYSNKEIIVSPFNSLPPISLYLDKEIFSPETNNYETFCKWNYKPFFISESEIMQRIKSKVLGDNFCIFITPNKILDFYPEMKIDLLKYCEETVIKSGRFYIYKIQKN